MPVYLCSPVTWNASRARMVSNGYVKNTALTPAAAQAKNLSECLIANVDGMTAPKY